MKIAEVFHSIQGEGILTGTPSLFIRTSGCNLRCVWCDTPYTSWAPEGEDMTTEALVEEVGRCPARHVVITGGEPMMLPAMKHLTEEIRRLGRHITIETAGTVFTPLACDLISISPKLSNSTPSEEEAGPWSKRHENTRLRMDVLKRLTLEYTHQLKFVIATPGDMEEVSSLVDELGASTENVVLMPEGTNPEVLRERGAWLAEICKQTGYRFSPRLHIELWGGRRGV